MKIQFIDERFHSLFQVSNLQMRILILQMGPALKLKVFDWVNGAWHDLSSISIRDISM